MYDDLFHPTSDEVSTEVGSFIGLLSYFCQWSMIICTILRLSPDWLIACLHSSAAPLYRVTQKTCQLPTCRFFWGVNTSKFAKICIQSILRTASSNLKSNFCYFCTKCPKIAIEIFKKWKKNGFVRLPFIQMSYIDSMLEKCIKVTSTFNKHPFNGVRWWIHQNFPDISCEKSNQITQPAYY